MNTEKANNKKYTFALHKSYKLTHGKNITHISNWLVVIQDMDKRKKRHYSTYIKSEQHNFRSQY
jgi:hypothetical protein